MNGLEVFGIGFFLGAVMASFGWLLSQSKLVRHIVAVQTEAHLLRSQAQSALESQDASRKMILDLTAKLAVGAVERQVQEKALAEQKQYGETLRSQTKLEFEHLAQTILQTQSQRLVDEAQRHLNLVLNPLADKIQLFEKRVLDTYNVEAKERHSLKAEVIRLMDVQGQMALEAQRLTQALTSNVKVQGNWGELVLERVLEASGLQRGAEYEVQTQFEGDNHEHYRPDVIIKLPENKHIVIDSKVSLNAYERYVTASSSPQREEAAAHLKEHIQSLRNHVESLAAKHYDRLKKLQSPDIVFLFIPIEPAYFAAVQKDPELIVWAWQKGLALVTGTTLLTNLKTAASVWRMEKQNRHALEIAQEGGRLYDKFVGFLADLEKIGTVLDQGRQSYQQCLLKLRDGSGSVFRKMERLRELGAHPTKQIPAHLME